MGSQVIVKGSQVNQLHDSCKMVKFPFTLFLFMWVSRIRNSEKLFAVYTSSQCDRKMIFTIKRLLKKIAALFEFVLPCQYAKTRCSFFCPNKTNVTSHVSWFSIIFVNFFLLIVSSFQRLRWWIVLLEHLSYHSLSSVQ